MIFSRLAFPLTIAALFVGSSIASAQISLAPQNAPTIGNEIRPEGEIPASPKKKGRQSVRQTLPPVPVESQVEEPTLPDSGRGGRQSVKQTLPSHPRDSQSNDASMSPNLPDGRQDPGGTVLAETAPPPKDFSACKSIGEIVDKDRDFQRNAQELSSNELCLQMDVFREGGLTWILQIIQNRKRPGGFLWFVPHDNENDAFDSAVDAVKKFGGVVVAVETGGSRYNGSQDPNRNFDAETGKKCREQVAPSPVYTQRVMRWLEDGARIFALHTNERGYTGDGTGGAGGISIARPLAGSKAFRAKVKSGQIPLGLSPDDTVVFVASKATPETDATLMQSIEVLRDNQINVLYETVSAARNDCSFSNYAALMDMRNYFNIEVVQSDGPTQKEIIERIVKLLPSGIGSLAPAGDQGPGSKKSPGGDPATELAPDPRQPRQPAAAHQTNMQTVPPAQPDAINSKESAAGTFKQRYDDRISREPRLPQPRQSAAVTPATPPEQTATAQPTDGQKQAGGFYAQLGSPLTQGEAKKTQDNVKLRFPEVVSRKPLSVREHVDKNNVVHYRVLLGPFSDQAEVLGVCQTLKAKKAECSFAKL